jgi:hypothetical protein
MLFIPEAIMDRLQALSKESKSDPEGAAARMMELWPGYAPARRVIAVQALKAGDRQRAEALFWELLELEPLDPQSYIIVATLLTERNEADVMAKRLRHLALWKMGLGGYIPTAVAESFKALAGEGSRDPEIYEVLARLEDTAVEGVVDPPDVVERLRPFRLLNDLQRDACNVLQPETLEAILEHGAECAPLFCNALREWAQDADAMDDDALCMLIAILGEIADADTAADLLELADTASKPRFLHANWAIFRLGQRFPAELLAQFRAARAGAPPGVLCAMADQMTLLEDVEGDIEFLTGLLDGFDFSGDEEEAAYLLGLVAQALADRGKEDLAQSVLNRHGKKLPKEGQRWLEDALNQDDGLVTVIVHEGIDGMSIEDVCLEKMLMEHQDEDEEFDEDDLIPAPPPPGRNEPCWCGSGKKYKKCHLAADEEEARERRMDAESEPPAASLQGKVLNDVMLASGEWHRKSDLRTAARLYFETDEPVEQEDEVAARFTEWVLLDYRDARTGQTAVENYLRTRSGKLTDIEREMLESLRDARYSVYRVTRTEPASGVHLHDLCTGTELFVHEASADLAESEVLAARVQYVGGRYVFVTPWVSVPESAAATLMATLEEESRDAGHHLPKYVAGQAHRLHRLVQEIGKPPAQKE